MEHKSSYRFFKLGIGLCLLVLSAVLPGMSQYTLMALGGVALMMAFASFGNYDYRGVRSKLIYRIIRCVFAVFLAAIAAIQIYVQFSEPGAVHYSPYSSVADVALLVYLLMFKPSATSIGKKIWKLIGYIFVLVGINGLQFLKVVVPHLTYESEEIDYVNLFVFCCIIAIGITCIVYGGRKKVQLAKLDENTPLEVAREGKNNAQEVRRSERSARIQWKMLLFWVPSAISTTALFCLCDNIPYRPSWHGDESARIANFSERSHEVVRINGKNWSKIRKSDADYDEWWQKSLLYKVGYENEDEKSKYYGESVLLRIYDISDIDFDINKHLQGERLIFDNDDILSGCNALYTNTGFYINIGNPSLSYYFKTVYIVENERIYKFNLYQSTDAPYLEQVDSLKFETVDKRFNSIVNSIDFSSYKNYLKEEAEYDKSVLPKYFLWSCILVAIALLFPIVGLMIIKSNCGRENTKSRKICISIAISLSAVYVMEFIVCYFSNFYDYFSRFQINDAFEFVLLSTIISIPIWIVMLSYQSKSFVPVASVATETGQKRHVGRTVLKYIITPFAYISALVSVVIDVFKESFKKQKSKF